MDEPSSQELAKKLSKQRLAEILAEAAATDESLAERLRIELMGDDTKAIVSELRTRIRSATRPCEFVDYRKAAGFSKRLYSIVSDIENRVLPLSPDRAIELCDCFLESDERVFNHIDDSSGHVGDVYRYASDVFVEAAYPAKDRKRLIASTLNRIRNNGYGASDPIHSNCGRFLHPDEFAEILEAVQEDFQKAPQDDSYSSERFIYEHAAESTGDPDLLQRVMLEIYQGTLPEYARLRIARLLSDKNRHEDAVELIDSLSEKAGWKEDIEAIRLAALEAAGKQDEIIAILRTNFESSPSPETYETWLDCLPEENQAEAREAAIHLATELLDRPETGIRLLVHLNEIDLAADLAISASKYLNGGSWYSLPDYAQMFEQSNRVDAAILIYRTLMEDILDSARYKAYGHAARYWDKLDRLATEVEPPAPHEPNGEYKARLAETHKRKSSF